MADSFNIGLGSQAQAAFNIGEGKKVTKEQREAELKDNLQKRIETLQKTSGLFDGQTAVEPKKLNPLLVRGKHLEMEYKRRETDLYYSENPEEAPKNYKPIYGFDTESFKIGKGPAKQSVFNIGDSKPKVESGMATGVRNGDIFQENIAIQNKKLQETDTELESTKKDIDKNIDKSFTTFE